MKVVQLTTGITAVHQGHLLHALLINRVILAFTYFVSWVPKRHFFAFQSLRPCTQLKGRQGRTF